jgi:Cu/Ag efflux protein CusF
MKNSERRSVLLLTVSVVMWSCAPAPQTPARPMATAPHLTGTVGANLVTTTARVKELDYATRVIALEQPGRRLRFRVDDSVRNLPQVKVGDEVTVSYYESLAYAVRKAGEAQPGAAVTEQFQRAAPGDKPAGSAARVTTITATIAGIDKTAGTVTLRGPDRDLMTVKARHPENLEKVAVGDRVDITYSEALAISVQEPAQKPAAEVEP